MGCVAGRVCVQRLARPRGSRRSPAVQAGTPGGRPAHVVLTRPGGRPVTTRTTPPSCANPSSGRCCRASSCVPQLCPVPGAKHVLVAGPIEVDTKLDQPLRAVPYLEESARMQLNYNPFRRLVAAVETGRHGRVVRKVTAAPPR